MVAAVVLPRHRRRTRRLWPGAVGGGVEAGPGTVAHADESTAGARINDVSAPAMVRLVMLRNLVVSADVRSLTCSEGFACFEAVTAEMFFHWASGQSDGPEILPATAAELPDQDRKPYPGWTE